MKSFIDKLGKRKLVYITLILYFTCVLILFLFSDLALSQIFFQSLFSFVILITVLLFFFKADNFNKELQEEIDHSYNNLEALLSILPLVNPRLPMPQTRNYAASPDFLRLLLQHILVNKPDTILELGGGVSTLYIGYILEKNQKGKIYSIDHSQEYSKKTFKQIQDHNLNDRAEVIYAPLEEVKIDGISTVWYNDFYSNLPKIDLLVIDGPPAVLNKKSRYPAIPLLFNLLSENAVIFVDDYIRKEDRDNVKLWQERFPELKLFEELTEKKTAILYKSL